MDWDYGYCDADAALVRCDKEHNNKDLPVSLHSDPSAVIIPGYYLGEVFWACPTRRRPQGRPKTHWRDNVS